MEPSIGKQLPRNEHWPAAAQDRTITTRRCRLGSEGAEDWLMEPNTVQLLPRTEQSRYDAGRRWAPRRLEGLDDARCHWKKVEESAVVQQGRNLM